MTALKHYFERFALAAAEKQDRLNAFLGEHSVELDLDAGSARFSSGIDLPFQVIGTESENSLTWLWAWAEEQTEIPDHLLHRARELREWGIREKVEEFALPSVDLDRADGTLLSLISMEICGASGYYRDHYEGGNLFLLLSAAPVERGPAFDRFRFVRALGNLASRYDFDLRKAMLSYFAVRKLPCTETGGGISAELENGERVLAEFDAARGTVTINGEEFV